MAVDFDVVITDEACTLAAIANSNSGWYLSPLRWELSSSSYGNIKEEDSSGKQYGQSITYNTRTTAFYSGPFSSVIPKENTLLHSIVIPPDLKISNTQIASINFIYRDMYGNEFLYAVAQPTSSIEYVYGTKQQFLFSFAIKNTTMSDTYVINYTYPQDIQDHNVDINAHDYFLKIDGSRNATGVLSYSTSNNFTKDNEIIDKKYVDTLKDYVDSLVAQRVAELKEEIQQKKDNILDYYCPIGSMLWWPQDPDSFRTADHHLYYENGGCWAIREGTSLQRSEYPELFKIIGHTYGGSGDTFLLPNDQGLFIRGYSDTLGITVGTEQLENCTVTIPYSGWSCTVGHSKATKGKLLAASGKRETAEYLESVGSTKEDRVVSGTNVVPRNRNYLPIIRVK